MTDSIVCACCRATLGWNGAYAHCDTCGLWQSRLPPAVLDTQAWQQLDETARGAALQGLRRGNFALLLQRLQRLCGGQHGTLLDIGAAHGWFVQQAQAAGFRAEGVEPDPRLAQQARAAGAVIREGFFPQVLAEGEQVDVLVFNDVFEHLPEPAAALQACASHLAPGGLLVLNIPLASGFFFALSNGLKRCGITAPWQRLWQAGFPSPHLYFYRREHLERMAAAAGFALVEAGSLPSMRVRGLWARMRMDHRQPLWLHVLTWPLLVVLAPLVAVLPPDIGLFFFRKR